MGTVREINGELEYNRAAQKDIEMMVRKCCRNDGEIEKDTWIDIIAGTCAVHESEPIRSIFEAA